MLIWPANIPSRMYRTGANLPYADSRRRFEADAGPGKLRKRLSNAIRPVSGAIDMTMAEHARLTRFWDVDTAGGVLPFWYPDWTRHGMPLLADGPDLPLLNGDGRPLLLDAWWLCQFGQEAPSPQPMAGGRMRVQISLSVLP